MDYVFILDISGSMASNGKLAISRASIGEFIKSLGTEDRFEVITFNVRPNTLFNQLQPVADASKKQAVDFLRNQQGRGGTVLQPAMATAYKYGEPDRPLNVVILSDGLTEQRERGQLLTLIGSRPTNTRVFCVGVGNDVNRPLLRQLAEDAGGLAAFISRGDDFARQASAFRRKLTRPVASNVRITFDGGNVYDVEPKRLPNLYHGMPIRLYGRYRNPGKVKVMLRAEINGAPLELAVDLELPGNDESNPEIERMWAWQKAARLLQEIQANGEQTGLVNEIVDLGESYSIVTPYTSFLVLENDAEYQRWKIERRNLRRLGRDRKSQAQLQEQLQAMRERALTKLGPSGAKETTEEKSAPSRNQNAPATQPQSNQDQGGRSWDISLPSGGGGGGAIDPITASIALGLAGLGTAARYRRRRRKDQPVAGSE